MKADGGSGRAYANVLQDYKIDLGLDDFHQIWTDVAAYKIWIKSITNKIWDFWVSRLVLPFGFGLGSKSRPWFVMNDVFLLFLLVQVESKFDLDGLYYIVF